jgi:hypothetical protein
LLDDSNLALRDEQALIRSARAQNGNLTTVRLERTLKQPDYGRFAGAVRPEQATVLTLADGQRHSVKSCDRSRIDLRNALKIEGWIRGHLFPRVCYGLILADTALGVEGY